MLGKKFAPFMAAGALVAALLTAIPAAASTTGASSTITTDASLLEANQGAAGQAYRTSPAGTTDADATIDGDHSSDGVSTGSAPVTATPEAQSSTTSETATQTCTASSGNIELCQSSGPAPETLGTDSVQASPSSIVGLPAYCVDDFAADFQYTRTDACLAHTTTITAINLDTGAPEGYLDYVVIAYAYTVTDLNTFAYQIQVQTLDASGYMATHATTLSANAICSGNCIADSSKFAAGVMKVDGTQSGESYFDWPVVSNTKSTLYPDWGLTTVTAGFAYQLPTSYVGTPEVRCDDYLSARAAGCVFPEAAPFISYQTSSYPTFTAHVSAAQASGLPGSQASGVPLRRLTSQTSIDANRNKACPDAYPRPKDRSCDEYPFASTYNGASFQTAGPRTELGCAITLTQKQSTGPNGYSVCMINGIENSAAGGVLGSRLYTPYRVLDGDHFYVNVTSGT